MDQYQSQPPAPSGPNPPPAGPPSRGWPPPASASPSGSSGWRDFVMFRSMITPGLITIIWVVGFVIITLGSILSIGATDNVGVGIIVALAIWLLSNLYLRVILELIVVLFRIYSRLGDVERNTRPR